MLTLDDIGGAIERRLDGVELRFARNPFGSLALGVLLALGVTAGGIATFALVFVVLVRFFS
jgi:hypothetical protein